MSISWKLKKYLANEHQIYTVTDFQKKIVKKTGIIISIANLCNYVNHRPKMIRLDTMEIICTALNCELAELLIISPKKVNFTHNKKLSFKNTPLSKIGVKSFPPPEDYRDHE